MLEDDIKKRGRPSGYIMSEISKRKISLKLKGRVLSEEHRLKISIAMMGNTNRSKRNSPTLIDDLYNDYIKDYSDENIGQWISSIREKLSMCSGIFSNRELSSYSFMELSVDDIDQFRGDSIDPEALLLISEVIKELDLNIWALSDD
jgi:hypothetical protein